MPRFSREACRHMRRHARAVHLGADQAEMRIEDTVSGRPSTVGASEVRRSPAHDSSTLTKGGPMDDSTSASHVMSAAEFHRAPGVSDWRVTGTGPQAVFLATSFSHAASLLAPVVDASKRLGVLPDVDVRPEGVVVRVPNRPDGIPAAAAEFAAAVSRAASDLSLTPDPSRAQSVGIYVAQHSQADARPFFLAALGYDAFGDTDAVDPLRCGPQLAFNPITGDTPARGRTHFDVFVPADQAQERVDAALAAGGRLVDDAYAPAWWSLASPDNHGVDIASWTDTYD